VEARHYRRFRVDVWPVSGRECEVGKKAENGGTWAYHKSFEKPSMN
jgi:hypothetical protein